MGGGSGVVNPALSVFSFDHDHRLSPAQLRALLGGKGFSLWLMRRELGLPVPPGFTIGTDECLPYLASGLSGPLEGAVRREVERIGTQFGKAFGDSREPLLVSVRSGAEASMPGMMDTILNVGMTPAIAGTLARAAGDAVFAQQSYLRFLVSFARIVHGLQIDEPVDLPNDETDLTRTVAKVRAALIARLGEGVLDDPWAQIFAAIGAVFASWNNPRSLAYRARAHVEDANGTAVTVQAMVFGNLDELSGTGVAFTRNPSTGDPAPCGDFLFRAQGDDVVGGVSRTLPLDAFKRAMPEAYGELAAAMATLERYHRDLCDIEFTVERGRLWLLQARVGKRSPLAAPRIAVDLVREGKVGLTPEEAVERIDPGLLAGAARIERAATGEQPIATGLGVSPGSATGRIVFTPDRAVELCEAGDDVLLVRRETSPDDVHGMGIAKGILTTLGGMMSHAAVVARAWGIPAVCGVENVELADGEFRCGGKVYHEGDVLSIDGDAGAVFAGAIASSAAIDPYLEILREWAAQTRIRASA
jgi:pyruvate, orthophosphate dikinase